MDHVVVETLKSMIVDGDFKRNQDVAVELKDQQVLQGRKRKVE